MTQKLELSDKDFETAIIIMPNEVKKNYAHNK